MSSQPAFTDLPLEIISRINTFLPIKAYLAFNSTCKTFQFLDSYDGRNSPDLDQDFKFMFKIKNNQVIDSILANILKRGFLTNEKNFADFGHIKTCRVMCEAGLTKDFLGRELLVAAGHGYILL